MGPLSHSAVLLLLMKRCRGQLVASIKQNSIRVTSKLRRSPPAALGPSWLLPILLGPQHRLQRRPPPGSALTYSWPSKMLLSRT